MYLQERLVSMSRSSKWKNAPTPENFTKQTHMYICQWCRGKEVMGNSNIGRDFKKSLGTGVVKNIFKQNF
jgi:hypothetical protein